MRKIELIILSAVGTLLFFGSHWFALYFHLIETDLLTLLRIGGNFSYWVLVGSLFLISFLYTLLYHYFWKDQGSMTAMINLGVIIFLFFVVIVKTPLKAEDFFYYGWSINLHVVFLSYSVYYRNLVGYNERQRK